MTREEILFFIENLSIESSFEEASEKIEEEVYNFPLNTYIKQLAIAGVIPEIYPHDSSAEKLYAKYLDSLLSRFFREFGFNSEVLKERSDAPDVLIYENNQVIIAGDAKGFRLSRTAKNQKDFKVSSLRSWAKKYEADYACLLAPLFQYPSKRSQIYEQAINGKVVLISFEECTILLKNKSRVNSTELLKLFDYSDIVNYKEKYVEKNELSKEESESLEKSAEFYRNYISEKICSISKITPNEYRREIENLPSRIEEEIELQLRLIKDKKSQLIDRLGNLVQLLKAEQRLSEVLERNKK